MATNGPTKPFRARTLRKSKRISTIWKVSIDRPFPKLDGYMINYWRLWEDCGVTEGNSSDNINGTSDRYSESIKQVVLKNRESLDTYVSKVELTKRLAAMIGKQFPDKNIELWIMGSTVNGIGTEGCDLDLCIFDSSVTCYDEVVFMLTNINANFIISDDISRARFQETNIPSLRIIVKRETCLLKVELFVNTVVNVRNTQLMYIAVQLERRIQLLAIAIKVWSHKKKDIVKQFSAVFPSHAVNLMVLHYACFGVSPTLLPNLEELIEELDTLAPKDLYIFRPVPSYMNFQSENTMTLGELLVGFFKYYSEFNFQKYPVAIRISDVLTKEETVKERWWKGQMSPKRIGRRKVVDRFVTIEDPFTYANVMASRMSNKATANLLKAIQDGYAELAVAPDVTSIFEEKQRNSEQVAKE